MNVEYINLRRELLRLKLEKFILLGLRMDDIPIIYGDVVIYGAGSIGKLLIRCFENKPIAFFDKRIKGNSIYGIPSYSIQEGIKSIPKDNVTVIITPVWDYEIIRDEIMEKVNGVNIISLDELVKKI